MTIRNHKITVGFCLLFFSLCTAGINASPLPHHRHHRHRRGAVTPVQEPMDLTPVQVRAYQRPQTTDPQKAQFLKKMNLEDGAMVASTRWITPNQVKTRDLFILDITQSLEGGFDSVNVYDKGILSWGLMQWSAQSGSLARTMQFVKRRLLATHQKPVWDKLFTANGLDVDARHLIVYGKPLMTEDDVRLAFRGSTLPGNYDPKLVTHWATVLARAGRQPEVADLQSAYAGHIVDAVLQTRLTGLPYHAPGRSGITVDDLAANDPFTEALVFALWTNNPRHAFAYVEDAARAARAVSVSDDPSLWTPGAFSDALLRRCRTSRFGNWRQRSAAIEARALIVRSASPEELTPFERDYQTVLAARKERRLVELASRHQAEQARKKQMTPDNALAQSITGADGEALRERRAGQN